MIEPHTGYLLKKGTWHSDRLPLYPPGSMMVIITDEETNLDLQEFGSMTTDRRATSAINIWAFIFCIVSQDQPGTDGLHGTATFVL